MNEAEPDVLAFMSFPTSHRAKLHSTNPIETPQRRDQAAHRGPRHFPNETAISRLSEPSCSNKTTNGRSSVCVT
jgi:putative transposase